MIWFNFFYSPTTHGEQASKGTRSPSNSLLSIVRSQQLAAKYIWALYINRAVINFDLSSRYWFGGLRSEFNVV